MQGRIIDARYVMTRPRFWRMGSEAEKFGPLELLEIIFSIGSVCDHKFDVVI
jgi:hypothetical protein